MSASTIKYIVSIAMLINHIAGVFMTPGTWASEILLSIGYVTAITMCYFLSVGARCTHDRKKYLFRICIFALISQLPYMLAFGKEGIIEFKDLNFLFNLASSLALLYVSSWNGSPWLKILAVAALLLLSAMSDWGILCPAYVLLFAWSGEERNKLSFSFLAAALLFGGNMFLSGRELYGFAFNAGRSLLNMAGMLMSAVLILIFYNGKRGSSSKFSKWFFYALYPLHLLVFGLIRIAML